MLSQGQPWYTLNEKLWTKFNNIEEMEGCLECELNIFDKINEDKFKYKGDISYKKLYEDNLSKEDQNMMLQYIRGYENVSLYTREFIGIDKLCDKKFNLNKDDHEIIIKNQSKERNCFIAEFIFISMVLSLYAKIMNSEIFKDFDKSEHFFSIYLSIIMLVLLPFFIFKGVFLLRIIQHNLSYNCSDIISNEVFRKENENTKKSILFISINLGFEVFCFLFISSYLILFFYTKKLKKR